jgi:hypothetical protein
MREFVTAALPAVAAVAGYRLTEQSPDQLSEDQREQVHTTELGQSPLDPRECPGDEEDQGEDQDQAGEWPPLRAVVDWLTALVTVPTELKWAVNVVLGLWFLVASTIDLAPALLAVVTLHIWHRSVR